MKQYLAIFYDPDKDRYLADEVQPSQQNCHTSLFDTTSLTLTIIIAFINKRARENYNVSVQY